MERTRARSRYPESSIRPITKAEFDEVAAGDGYYRGRWTYMAVAGDLAGDLILRHGPHSGLE
jgi:hypothetical protein